MKIPRLEKISYIPIVADGLIAHPETADGRLIPVAIIDCSKHREIRDLIALHQEAPSGDVVSIWSYDIIDSTSVYLNLRFSRPTEVQAILRFDLNTQVALADAVVQARGVYLQSNEFGKRISESITKPKLLIEVPPETKLSNWDKILLKQLRARFRREGQSKATSSITAQQVLDRMRELFAKRMRM